VNSIWLLMGLLLLSYVGSFLVGGRAIRGVGLPSGTEYVVFGFLLGPSALGLVERSMLELFQPVAEVAVGWLVFVLGLNYGMDGNRRVRMGRVIGGSFIALLTGAAVGAAAWFFLRWRADLEPMDRLMVAAGIGAVSAETTRYAVQWVVERHLAKGPVSQLVADLADSDDLAPLIAVAFLFALRPVAHLSVPIVVPFHAMAGITLGLGVVLGIMAALLLGRQFQLGETWSVLIGMSLLLIGTTNRLGLSTIAAMFAMGVALSAASRHRVEIVAMVMPTERGVMLPALLLAGAHVNFTSTRYLPWLIAACLAARVFIKWLVGIGLLAVSRDARRAGPRLGLGLLSAGALAMSIGLAFALRFPGPVGDLVLATAAVTTVLGEFVGPASLRSVLRRVGEIPEEQAPATDTTKKRAASATEAITRVGASLAERALGPAPTADGDRGKPPVGT
jgi:Kef-type K+ transport system membrane component KefB